MKRFRRILVAVVALLVAVVATACSNKSNSSKGGYTPKSLTIQFVPSQAATKLQARAKPLERCFQRDWVFLFTFLCQLTTTLLWKL